MPDSHKNKASIYAALDYAHTGMCVVRKDYVVNFWNKRLVEWTFISKEQITGKKLSDFFPALREKRNTIRLDEIFNGGPPVIFSSQIHKHLFPAPLANGELRIQHVTVTAIPSPDNDGYYALFAVEDVTELTQRMAELDKARSAAEMANRSKSDFLANMSHEIRTPMNGVLGMCDILMKSGLTDTQQGYVHMIERSGRALLTIINDILDFSKIEAGKMTLLPAPCDMRKTIYDLIELLSFSAEKKDIRLTVDYDDTIPRYFIADDGRIRQVLMNLISNAIKFTERGSITVIIATSLIDESYALVNIIVKDTGIGIAEDVQPVLFNKFIQVDSSLTRKFQGTGLGLAISKQLCKLMGGDISLKSKLGEGSEFSIQLPLPLANEEQAQELDRLATQKLSSSDSYSFRAQILLVEDNQINQAVALHILKQLDCIVEVAENGQFAIEKLLLRNYDLVFMDCQMPVLDGYSATRYIRNLEKTAGRHTPIVAMTAHAMEGDREKCLECGMDDYISKPIEPSTISSILGKFCPHRKITEKKGLQPSILIADDEVIALRELNEIVKQVFPDAIINNATDGVEACMLLGNFHPDIFICDILIPNMDGEAVISYMKRNHQFSKTRIIVVTGLSPNDQSVQRIKEMGIAGIIYKPVSHEKLTNLIRNIVTGSIDDPFPFPHPLISQVFSIDYRGLVESSLHGIAVFQKDSFKYANASFARIFSTTPDIILKNNYHNLKEVIHPEDREITESLLCVNQSTDHTPNRRVIRILAPQETLYIDMYSCAIQQDGQNLRLLLATDITDWVSSNESLKKHHNAIERNNREWTGFIGSMTNELRNPLSTIIGASRIIQSDTLSKRQQHQTEMINDSAALMAALINELNDHTFDTLDIYDFNVLSFDLYTAVQEVTKLAAPRIFAHNLEFIVNYDYTLNNRFLGDPGRIRQILTHLLNDAIEQTTKGFITLEISQLPRTPLTAIQLTFAVTYTGGLQENISNIDISTDISHSNMSIAQQIATAMGGKLESQNQDQCSSHTFTITLEPDIQSAVSSPDLSIIKNLRVIYYDNTPHTGGVIIDHLEQSGMCPEYFHEIGLIYSKLEESYRENNPYTIVIFDCNPDDKKVAEIAGKIKQNPLLQNTSLLLLTNVGKRGDAARVKQAGFDGYIVKPIFPMELEKICAMVISKENRITTERLVTRHTILEMSNGNNIVEDCELYENLSVLIIIEHKLLRENVLSILSSFKCNSSNCQSNHDLLHLTDKIFDLLIVDWVDIKNNSDLLTITKQFKNINHKPSPVVTLVNSLTSLVHHKDSSESFFSIIEKPVSINNIRNVLQSINQLKQKEQAELNDKTDLTKLKKLPESIISVDSLLERLGDDVPFALDLLSRFATSLPDEIILLKNAINTVDFKNSELIAHRIKGAARNLSVNQIMNTLQSVEHSARAGDIDTVKTLLPEVDSCVETFLTGFRGAI